MYYTYVLQNTHDSSLYIGYTSNLKRRIHEHMSGTGCRTTKSKEGWCLIYYEAYTEKMDAVCREKFLKGGSGRKYLLKQMTHYFLLHTPPGKNVPAK
jgi:putative endonuclease